MKEKIQKSLSRILKDLYANLEINIENLEISIQENKDKEHGDLASNIALVLSLIHI